MKYNFIKIKNRLVRNDNELLQTIIKRGNKK